MSAFPKFPGYEDATPDVFDAVLEEGGEIAKQVLFPMNRLRRRGGRHFENGVVRTPRGFKESL